MKRLAKLSGVPLERILKFQKRESDSGRLLSGDRGMSGGDLHLYKTTAIALAKKLKDKKLVEKLQSLSTKQTGNRLSFSPYSKFLVENTKVQDMLLLQLLKDTKKMSEDFVKKEFNRMPEDHEHYAFWNASPAVAKKAVKSRFMSEDPKLRVLQKNIKGFLGQQKSYLEDKPSKPSKPSMSFEQAFNEARSMGQKEFEFRGRRFNTRMKGESPEEFEEKFKFVDDQKFDSVEEFDRSKDEDIAVEEKKIIEEARQPDQEIKAEDVELEQTIPMDQSVPFGVFARGTDEFKGAQEQAFVGAKGGEVNPRIPRKKGQPAKSKKHSDLYTDEDPRGTIQGLGFKDVPKAKSSVSKIRKSSRSHAHKVQAAVAMEQRAREMGKTSEAAVYRKFIDQMKERTKKMKKADGGEVESKRFISTLPFETRRKLADEELDEIGFRRIREAREKSGNKGFQAARVNPDEIEKIETKYGVFDELSDEEKESEMRQNRMFQQGQFQEGGEVDEQMAAFRAADAQSMQQPTEEFQGDPITSRDPIEDVPEVQGFVPQRQPDVQPDVDPEVQDLETRPDPFPKRDRSPDMQGVEEFQLSQMSTRELLDKKVPGQPQEPAVTRELTRRKKEFDGLSLERLAELEEGSDQRTETDKLNQPVVKKRPPVTEEKRKTFRELFDEAEKQRIKDEADLRKREDEILAIVERPIDPKRLYKNMSTFDKVVGLISLAAGAYDAYKSGGPNLYLKQLDKAVEDDIKEQQLERKEQQYKKAQMLHNAKILAGRLARATKDRDKKANFIKLQNTFDVAYKKNLRANNEKVRKIKFIETLNKRGITSREIAYADSVYPELKVGQKVIKGRDGLFYYSRGDVKKLKEYISDAQDSIDGLAQLEEYVDRVSIFEQIPGASIISKDAAGAQSLRDRLVGKLRIEFFGPGVMTDNEREQAKKILGNPNAFFSTDAVEKEKIRNLLLKINYGIRQKLRRDGLAIPESQNDRMVKAWLKRERKPLTDRNKALAVNALITAEKKHVENGGRPGKHWNIDEPLPI